MGSDIAGGELLLCSTAREESSLGGVTKVLPVVLPSPLRLVVVIVEAVVCFTVIFANNCRDKGPHGFINTSGLPSLVVAHLLRQAWFLFPGTSNERQLERRTDEAEVGGEPGFILYLFPSCTYCTVPAPGASPAPWTNWRNWKVFTGVPGDTYIIADSDCYGTWYHTSSSLAFSRIVFNRSITLLYFTS